MTTAVLVESLAKSYGSTKALVGVDLEVPEGTIVGLLGPNGAGKTTVVRILATLLRADSGRAEVFGRDVGRDADDVRAMIGLTGQYAAVDEYLTGFENLDMVGRLYRMGKAAVRERADDLLRYFDLADARDRPVKTYSGGMRRRLDIAASLIARPRVLFLDEPTTGLDPRSRLGMWELIETLAAEGTTILLTTQYLDEADRLADSITVIDRGQVIARGTADELKAQVGGERLELVVADAAQLTAARDALASLAVETPNVDEAARRVTVPVTGGAETLREALGRLAAEGIAVLDVGLRRPDLDDVFLTLTGHAAEDDVDGEAAEDPPGATSTPAKANTAETSRDTSNKATKESVR